MAGGERNDMIPHPAAEVAVVMVPFVAHGHLNQFAYLSRLISSYNIPVHFVSTTTHVRQLRSRHHDSSLFSAASNLIYFHELSTPPFTSPPPHPSNRFPSHLQPAFESTLHLRRPVTDLVLSLSTTTGRVAVVHDFMMSYVVQDVKQIANVETYIFSALSAFDSFCSTWKRIGRPFPVGLEILNRLPTRDGCLSPDFLEFVKLQQSHEGFQVGTLFDASRAIEGEYIEYLEREEINSGKKKLWAVGPINPGEKTSVSVSKNRHNCLQWLDSQPPNSVVYVSFGTTTTFNDQQVKEIAIGLERSQQKFVWVARAADKGDVFSDDAKIIELPNGFEERVEGRGLVVRDWAPQVEILGHYATGGFMSHCGWNSSMESISMGVPMVTWPMHSDQPLNAFFITEVLKIGLAVIDWEHRDELVTSVVVGDVIKRLMDSREGDEMRKRAAELRDKAQRSVAEGGVSRRETDSFVSYIRRPI